MKVRMTPHQLTCLLRQAGLWAAADPDPQTRDELNTLIAAATNNPKAPAAPSAMAEIEERFRGNLSFGTAGLRAPMGAGPMRMNRIVVRQATIGLARYVLDKISSAQHAHPPDDPAPPAIAVVGYDGRHKSYDFARDAVTIFTALGFTAYLMPHAVPTPVTAYACRALNAEVAVMVTASHNPAYDNGYKVYLGGRLTNEHGKGAQIVSPTDREIAAEIAAVDPLTTGRIVDPPNGGVSWLPIDKDLLQSYTNEVRALITSKTGPAKICAVLTAMHGVGGKIALDVLGALSHVYPVTEQFSPDPEFPTVIFPNPEEPEAMELSFALAARLNRENALNSDDTADIVTHPVDCVIALDPDADRCAVGVVSRAALTAGRPATRPEDWIRLSGDEVGILLAQHILSKLECAPDSRKNIDAPRAMANSLVSTPLLERMAISHQLDFHYTLSGSKWISRVPGLVYGFEESLGYCASPHLVRDKDGISAALLFTEFLSTLKARGETVWDVLDAIALRYGLYETSQCSIRVKRTHELGPLLDRLSKNPPRLLLNSEVTECADLKNNYRGLPAAQGLVLQSAIGNRCIIRPSGTEPKLKIYSLTVSRPKNLQELSAARRNSRRVLKLLEDNILQLVETLRKE